jgi:hypothetical protein
MSAHEEFAAVEHPLEPTGQGVTTEAGAGEAAGDPVRESARGLGDRAVWLQRDLGWDGLVEEARRLGPDPDLADLLDDEVEAQVCGIAAEIAALTARWLDHLCELVVRGIWADQGARTPAQWLSWRVGLAPSTAREHVRVALRLRELPKVRAAFALGALSYSKVRAMTRFAVPEIEDLVLQWADVSTAAQLEQVAADFRTTRRAAGLPEDGDDPEDPRYSWRTRSHADGTMTITIRGPVEECAELCALLERRLQVAHAAEVAGAADDRPEAEPASAEAGDDHDPAAATTAHGDVVEAASEAATASPIGREGASAEAPGSEVEHAPVFLGRGRPADLVRELVDVVALADPTSLTDTSGLDRHTLVLHASLADVQDRTPGRVAVEEAHGRVRGLDRDVLRQLACEAGIILAAVDGDGTPMDVGRRNRQLTAALRRALVLRDRTCRFPGCDATRHLHAHHIEHWANGGPTDLANLILLCSHHHRFVHQHGLRIELRPGGPHRFYTSDGSMIERHHRLRLADEAVARPRPEDLGDLQPSYVDLDRPIERSTITEVLHQEIRRLAPDLATAA